MEVSALVWTVWPQVSRGSTPTSYRCPGEDLMQDHTYITQSPTSSVSSGRPQAWVAGSDLSPQESESGEGFGLRLQLQKLKCKVSGPARSTGKDSEWVLRGQPTPQRRGPKKPCPSLILERSVIAVRLRCPFISSWMGEGVSGKWGPCYKEGSKLNRE